MANPLGSGWRDRLMAATVRRQLVDDEGKPLYSAISKAVDCERQAIWAYFKLDKERQTVDLLLFLRLCDALSVTPYWLALGEGSIDDLPLGKKPFEEPREASKEVGRKTKKEERHEANKQGERSSQHPSRA